MEGFGLRSIGEGPYLMLLDARVAGSPIITTDIGASCDGVDHDENGLLLPNDDGGAMNGALADVY
jgi:glycosyltransferase involved in cell wall biosynthesis